MPIGPAVSITGWLEKQAEWKFAWNRRFFALSGKTLSYREDGALTDKKCAMVQCLQKDVGLPFAFRVWTERGGCWMLRASGQDEHEKWVSAITTALLEEHPDEVLCGTVLKCSSWTKSWRSRFLMLDGLELSYSDKAGEPVKNKYIIASADLTLCENEVRFSTTIGESFLVRFEDKSETDKWLDAVRLAERRAHTLRWQQVTPTGDCTHYCGATNHMACNFEGKHVLVFGGSLLIPNQGKVMQRELVMVSLAGSFPASKLHPAPFEEAAHAKVVPQARECGASTFLASGTYVLFGGMTNSPLDVLGDLWIVHIATRGGWHRCLADAPPTPATSTAATSCLPKRFGHSMHAHYINDSFLVVGGFDSRLNAQSDVWRCTVHRHTAIHPKPDEVTITKLPSLPDARALHAGVTMEDGALVLLGGCRGKFNDTVSAVSCHQTVVSSSSSAISGCSGPHSTTPCAPHEVLLVLPKEDNDMWVSVSLVPPLPPNTFSPAACAHGSTIFLWCDGAGERDPLAVGAAVSAPRLFGVTMSGGFALVTEFQTRGTVPGICRGVSMHICDDYCYLIGESQTSIARLLLPTGRRTSPTSGGREAIGNAT